MLDDDNVDFSVELNGRLLSESEYYWGNGNHLVLKFPRPASRPPTFREKFWRFLTGQWRSINDPISPIADVVLIENWVKARRELLIGGTPEFDERISYAGDTKVFAKPR